MLSLHGLITRLGGPAERVGVLLHGPHGLDAERALHEGPRREEGLLGILPRLPLEHLDGLLYERPVGG